jgi:predicted HAD superfamily Cof-like phosphohydrolase
MKNYKEENDQIVKAMLGKQSHLEMVKEWHKVFGMPIHNTPEKTTYSDLKLRINLLEEELEELKDALLGDNNEAYIDVLDALCDLQYVLSGAILQLGFSSIFDKAFHAVHQSNMSKAIDDYETALKERDVYCNSKDVDCVIKEQNGKFVLVRSSDGKILKPSGYTPVDLNRLILELLDNG